MLRGLYLSKERNYWVPVVILNGQVTHWNPFTILGEVSKPQEEK